MKIKGLFFYALLLICYGKSVEYLDGLETTFNLFDRKCFINTIFVECTANFILYDTPIQHTKIDIPITAKKIWLEEVINPRNRSLSPSWRIKHLECVLNTIVDPTVNWRYVWQIIFLINTFFGRLIDPPYKLPETFEEGLLVDY